MSTQAPTHFVKGFKQGITHLAEQKESRLRNHVRFETLETGDRNFFDQVGSVTAVPSTTRHADTPLTDTPQSRRMVVPVSYKHADLIDKADMLRTLNDPSGAFSVAFGRAFGRAADDVIIAAALGTAKYGVDGSSSETFPGGDYTIAAGAAGLTLVKIIGANKVLRAAENDPEEGFKLCVSQEQMEDVLNDSTITSSDYASMRALMSGSISSFMGFDWIQSERLTTSTDRQCLAWAKNSILFGTLEEFNVRVSERADKSYSTQVFAENDMGATRMDATGVIDIRCVE